LALILFNTVMKKEDMKNKENINGRK